MYPILALTGTLLLTATAAPADYAYQAAGRQLVRNGVQAVITCNGLFTSQRSLEQVFAQELAYLGDRRLGDASGGNYRVSSEEQWVEVGGGDDGPAIIAAFRTGIGCVVMAPGMTSADIPTLPQIEGSSMPASSQSLPWPQGEVAERGAGPGHRPAGNTAGLGLGLPQGQPGAGHHQSAHSAQGPAHP